MLVSTASPKQSLHSQIVDGRGDRLGWSAVTEWWTHLNLALEAHVAGNQSPKLDHTHAIFDAILRTKLARRSPQGCYRSRSTAAKIPQCQGFSIVSISSTQYVAKWQRCHCCAWPPKNGGKNRACFVRGTASQIGSLTSSHKIS